MIRKVPDDSEFLRNLKSTSDFELFDVNFVKVAVDQQEAQAIVLLEANGKIFGIDLNSIEGTIYTFVKSGCSDNSHIKNIYQMFCETMHMIKFELEKVIIEAKSGDMTYSRLIWKDQKDRKIISLCSAGDGIVLAEIKKSPLYITKAALELADDYSNFNEEFNINEE